MFKRCCLLILMTFLLSNCAHHAKPSAPSIKAPLLMSSQQTRTLSAFSQVDVQGRVNVNLHTGYKKPLLIVRGDPRDLAELQSTVNTQTLYIRFTGGAPRYGQVNVDVHGGSLDKVRYVGSGMLTGSQLNTRLLDLDLENQGTTRLGGSLGIQDLTVKGKGLVQLSGVHSYNMGINLIGDPKVQIAGAAHLSKLTMTGDGSLSMYWVKGYNLAITAKNKARLQLAGAVNHLELDLHGMAQFKGRYLRAQRSFVKTYDRSIAEISSVNHQSSLASDASDIYYYNIPTTRADFMAFDGSVLDMRDLSSPYMDQEYKRYNKQFP